MADFKTVLTDYSSWFNQQIPAFFPVPQGLEKRAVEAMHYSLSGGGKRLRPFLTTCAAKLFGIGRETVLPAAMSLECLHTYSLIHDDLPAMDNDDLRRGRPTCHKQYDEATAILAGDGLLTYAFEILSDRLKAAAAVKSELVSLLAKAAGAFNGMVAGQMLDLTPARNLNTIAAEQLINRIEEMKTGCLIRYACEAGAVLGEADAARRQALVTYSRKIGAAFQIADDILDIEGNPELMGKTLGKDQQQDKLTFVSLYGLDSARQMAAKLIEEAKQSLRIFGDAADTLSNLADFIIRRSV